MRGCEPGTDATVALCSFSHETCKMGTEESHKCGDAWPHRTALLVSNKIHLIDCASLIIWFRFSFNVPRASWKEGVTTGLALSTLHPTIQESLAP